MKRFSGGTPAGARSIYRGKTERVRRLTSNLYTAAKRSRKFDFCNGVMDRIARFKVSVCSDKVLEYWKCCVNQIVSVKKTGFQYYVVNDSTKLSPVKRLIGIEIFWNIKDRKNKATCDDTKNLDSAFFRNTDLAIPN